MTKQEFLSILREALEGNIPLNDVDENIRFYENYFRESTKSQEEICEELGDPRLIARTIIDSFAVSKGSMAGYYTEQARSEFSREERAQNGNTRGASGFGDTGGKWYDRLFGVVIMAGILVVIAAVFIFLLQVAVYVVIPVVLIVFIVKILSDLFRRY